jgi:arylsulfatase A-like enzyme
MNAGILALAVALLPALAAGQGGGAQPNVVVVLADDQGPGDLSCYGGKTPTPNLDRMAREGVRLTRYYAASPICSPSRCGLITGQYPGWWRITSFLQTRAGNRACGQDDFLDPDAPSLARALRAAGYRTCHVGKWHLGGGRDVAAPPKFAAYGYDAGLGTWESPEPHPDLTARDWIWSAADKVKRWERTRWMVERTLAFLGDNPDRPCFVTLWLDDPHTPWVPTADDQQAGQGGRAAGKGNTPQRLAKVLTEMDRQVGRLLAALRERKGGRPSLVLFVSDNGPLPTFERARTAGLRGSKLSLYEGGVRVPCIAWGPGLVPGGVTNDTVFAAVDLFPTLCTLCRAAPPRGYQSDGQDLSPALLGKAVTRTKVLFWEYGRQARGLGAGGPPPSTNDKAFAFPKGGDRSPAVAVRDGDWKLLVNADGTGAELYDLAADPNEARDLSGRRPEIARRLRERAVAWRKSLP